MFKCNVCDREFKSKGGLTRHSKTCESKETVEVSKSIPEAKEELVGNVLDDRTLNKIDKLLDLRSSTYDAKTRNDIDIMIRELKGL
jgi:hypothetical protein